MNSKQLFFGMVGTIAVLACALVFGAHMTVGILKERSQKLVQQKLQVEVLDSQQAALAKAKKEIKQYAQLESIAKTIVPADKDQAETVREIVNIASRSGITLSNITFPSSALGQGTSSASSSRVKLSQLTPAKGLSGIYQLPITIDQDANSPVSYSQFISFLQQIEQNRRTAQVTSISLIPNADNPSLLSFSLIINEYIKP
ncbi:MAG TPA: hypothetical protein VG604_04515 [Candidatus Saccharimonadales bacterium]|nr:hypothetical protein [Candidatus Saccharimonadales bacterium]